MIRFITGIIALCSVITSAAQTGVAINTNGAAPAAPALLDVSSTSKGVLIPRMNSAQRKFIASPEPGLMVYDLDKATFYFYDGGQWRPLSFTTENRLLLIERKPTEPADATCMLGADVAMFGTYAAASAPSEKVNNNWDQGTVYIYAQQNNTWNLQQKVSATDGANGDNFGESIALYNDLLVVGAPNATVSGLPGNGAAYVFKRSGQVWTQVKKLLPPANEANGSFGWDVSVYNGKILVGTPHKTVSGKSGAGAAYLYEPLNNDWQFTKEFKAATALQFGNFGKSVKLYGNDAVIGYPGYTHNNITTGSVQVFTRTPPSVNWQEQSIITSEKSEGMGFGTSVDIYMDTIIVGAPYFTLDISAEPAFQSGKYELWQRINGTWTYNDFWAGKTEYQQMGTAVAVNGPYHFVSSPGPSTGIRDGKVDGMGPSFLREYRDVDQMISIAYGANIAISGNHFIIGAPAKNGGRGSIQFGNMD